MDYFELGYVGLFLICFLSATILPMASEGVLLLFLAASYNPWTCLLVASTGNSLGSVSNYWLGRLGKPEMIQRFFRSEKQFQKINRSIHKHGFWLGSMAWVPILGDPMTVALGFFRVPFLPFAVVMTVCKALRYWLIIFLFN